ncbi:zinc finger protein 474-like [Adelges cooleyi]|uniref:zinc finger protein 474-like n=1 Tax=Adelges cooleyi TaxID=133065 RepID=UPI0021809571|nr:zinc finger protein 474-like [Adelges cooleyi]
MVFAFKFMEMSAETATAMKPKRFPSIFKKIMISRLKSISKDANSAVKAPNKKTSANRKPQPPPPPVTTVERDSDPKRFQRPATATLDNSMVPQDNGTSRPPVTPSVVKRPSAAHHQQLNSRTYRIKTKDRKSVLSLPEVQAKVQQQQQQASKKKSYLPVKVKTGVTKKQAPQPPVRVQPTTAAPAPAAAPAQETTTGYRPENWVPTAVSSARKKRLVLCYLCGKEFGTASLPFHEPQCLKKWILENSQLPEHLQRATPQKPEGNETVSAEDWNRLAWEATQSNLVPCDYCQRKFLASRLEAHTRVCIEAKKKYHISSVNKSQRPPAKPSMDKQPKKKPQPCYVCGRLFGSASIGIHEPQCLIKWTRDNDSLPPHLRRPVPTKPEIIIDAATGQVDQQATREEYWKTYLSQLVPCDRCQRTFDPDRLEVHQRSCKGITTK